MLRWTLVLFVGCGASAAPSVSSTPVASTEQEDADDPTADPEVREAYAREADVREVLRFSWTGGDRTAFTDDAIARYVMDHEDELRAEFERNRHRYTDLEEQLRSRHILFQTRDAVPEEARRRCGEIRAEIRRGDSTFEEAARQLSDDRATAARGGDLGFNPRGRMVSAYEDAVYGLREGRLSPCFETRFGWHLARLDGRRSGDVPFHDAAHEMAERELRLQARRRSFWDLAERVVVPALTRGASLEELDALLAEHPIRRHASLRVVPGMTSPAGFEGLEEHARAPLDQLLWFPGGCPSPRPCGSESGLRSPQSVVPEAVWVRRVEVAPLDSGVAACLRARLDRECTGEPVRLPIGAPCGLCVPEAVDAVQTTASLAAPDVLADPEQMRRLIQQLQQQSPTPPSP